MRVYLCIVVWASPSSLLSFPASFVCHSLCSDSTMYGGYYVMNPGMRQAGGGYNGGPMMQQQQQMHYPRQQQSSPQPYYAQPPQNYHSQSPQPYQTHSPQPYHNVTPPSMQARLRGGPTGPVMSPSHGAPGAALQGRGGGGNTDASTAAPAPGQLNRNPSFMMMHNHNNFAPPNPMMHRMGSFTGAGSMGLIPRFGSYVAPGDAGAAGGGNPYQNGGCFASTGTGAGSLHRVNSGMNFDYSTGSQMQGAGGGAGPMMRHNSYGTTRQTGSFFGGSVGGGAGGAAGGAGGRPQQLSRQNSAMGSYSYGSFRQPSFSQHSMHNGATGLDPGTSTSSMNGMLQPVDYANSGASNPASAEAASPNTALTRQDSAKSLQRSYSIAGQFYTYGGAGAESGEGPNGANGAGGVMPPMNAAQQRLSQMPGMGPEPGGLVTLNAITAAVGQRGPAAPGALPPHVYHQMMMQQQRRMNGPPEAPNPDAQPSKGTSENTAVAEGQPQALGRKNSVSNLTRKNSEKRVGMYFKNKEATEQDGVQYKKDGDPGTAGKNNARARDPSLTSTVKAAILLDTSAGRNPAIEVDGHTIRADKPGAEEVQKYDMRDVMYVNRTSDVQLSGDLLEEMRDNFVYGCNVGMIMADAGQPASRPTEWFSWLALRSVVKGAFGKLASTQFEFTMSVCLLQDDQVMDLLTDPPYRFVNLVVAESPLFGNVANGMVYVCVEDAGEFNDVLEASLFRAQEQCSPSAEEHGIVLCTCVLKQVKTSQSSGKEDVVVSSIFASGVGNGVIHYNRIIDKNPAEPRALFYSVMHRSVHSTALFSCPVTDEEAFNYLATLQRFSKVETRRPKVGSTRAFVAYGTSTIPKIREDLEKGKDGRQRLMMQRQLEKLELMVADAEDMLASPADCVPKTYI